MPTKPLETCVLLVAIATCLGTPIRAQRGVEERQITLGLSAHVSRSYLLNPATPQVQDTVLIDEAEEVTLVFGSASKTLEIVLTAPTGEAFSVDSPETPMVTGFVFPDPDNQPDAAGANYIFDLSAPIPGTWSYTIRELDGPTSARAVLMTMVSSSSIRSGILGGGRDYRADRPVPLALATADADEVLTDVRIDAMVQKIDDSSASGESLRFVDDGTGNDANASDGLFSASFLPDSPGDYKVTATVRPGPTDSRTFERTATAVFTVHEELVSLDRTVSDRGVDTDGDGLLNEIRVAIGVEIAQAGRYNSIVVLENRTGKSVRNNVIQSLPLGSTSVEVPFGADAIRSELQTDGPYEIAEARLEALDPDPDVTADFAFDLGLTSAYGIDRLEREPILLTNGATARGTDIGGNGKFDFLDTTFPADLLDSGFYRWSARLVDPSGEEITLSSNDAFFGGGDVDLTLRFDGRAIGEHGVDGPYDIRSLIVFGAGDSLIVSDALETPAFAASDFEGFDQEPPEIDVSVTPSRLWPVNHKLVEIGVELQVTDNVDPDPEVRLESIVSDQDVNFIGDGNTSPDIVVEPGGRILLRAERAGATGDRIYTLTWSARDFAGNTATASAEVRVPHDQRGRGSR